MVRQRGHLGGAAMTTLAQSPLDRLRGALADVRDRRSGFDAACPVPGCEYRVSVDPGEDGRALIVCRGGCGIDAVLDAIDWQTCDLFVPNERGGGRHHSPPNDGATGQRFAGCTLGQYAAAKRLPINDLRAFGLRDFKYWERPSIRIPYRDQGGLEVAARFRVALDKPAGGPDDRFVWKSSAKPSLYGRDRLSLARDRGYVVLVEGESDCHTLWVHDEPAVGLPGAGQWKDARDAPELAGIPIIYVVVEPDAAGGTLVRHLAASTIRDRVNLLDLGGHKDPSALYLADPAGFHERWDMAKTAAESLADRVRAGVDEATTVAWEACADLAGSPDILDQAAAAVAAAGVAGEHRAIKLVFLVATSRLLDKPASAAVKGVSSGGKSYLTEQTLRLFPDDAYYALSAMSERALAYSEEPLAHRILVIYEAAGLTGDFASYLMRSLLSEGRVRYETVEKTKDGLKARLIEREGPTGLLVTTTAVHLHPENETRMLSIPVDDTPEQTRAVFHALAHGTGPAPDHAPWHALQAWLAGGERRVAVPFAWALAELIPPAAVRLRRDFGLVLTLIRAHALLHRASRGRDGDGRIVATLADYAAVRALIADLIAEGVEATVPASVRETTSAVRRLLASPALLTEHVRDEKSEERTCSVTEIAKELDIDKSAASRRIGVATDRGYLKNLEDRRGRPAKIALGDPLPEEVDILPNSRAVSDRWGNADSSEGSPTPRFPTTKTDEPGKQGKPLAPDTSTVARASRVEADRCSVEGESAGVGIPPPHTDADDDGSSGRHGAGGGLVCDARESTDARHATAEVEPMIDPVFRATVENILNLSQEDLTTYQAELDTAPLDDPYLALDRAALALADAVRQRKMK